MPIKSPVAASEDGTVEIDIGELSSDRVSSQTLVPDGFSISYGVPVAFCSSNDVALDTSFPVSRAAGPVVLVEGLTGQDEACTVYVVSEGSPSIDGGDSATDKSDEVTGLLLIAGGFLVRARRAVT
jgi:hypothetical protein